MRKQYLHVIAYPCDKCKGPVVAGSLGIRETVISRETQVMLLGGVCLACGNKQAHSAGVGYGPQILAGRVGLMAGSEGRMWATGQKNSLGICVNLRSLPACPSQIEPNLVHF